jgi:type II secretory pathway predicted ATPase ExeA
MNNKQQLAIYGLKWNPFLSDVPVEDLWSPPGMESFMFRVENLVMDGGYALVVGEPGLGKSKSLQLLAHRLAKLEDVVVGVMERPQSTATDFYREMGVLFGVNLTPANRYGGFKALRERWRQHIKTTLFRPVLIVDEAQEMNANCLNELRLLSSAHFDSQSLLTTVLCGDTRLPDRFRSNALVALGSRIRCRMILEPFDRATSMGFLEHLLERAGAPQLMSQALKQTLVDHASGNPRMLTNMGGELFTEGAKREIPQLDEALYLEIFSRQPKMRRRR